MFVVRLPSLDIKDTQKSRSSFMYEDVVKITILKMSLSFEIDQFNIKEKDK